MHDDVPPRGAILLIEDNPHDVLLTRRAFRKAGIDAPLAVVSDGEQAVGYLAGAGEYTDRQSHPWPTLVLLDWKLPRMSGAEVLRWIREQPTLDATPVVVLTSSREEEDVLAAYRAGANSYLNKPVAFDALLQMLERLHAYWLRTNIALLPDR